MTAEQERVCHTPFSSRELPQDTQQPAAGSAEGGSRCSAAKPPRTAAGWRVPCWVAGARGIRGASSGLPLVDAPHPGRLRLPAVAAQASGGSRACHVQRQASGGLCPAHLHAAAACAALAARMQAAGGAPPGPAAASARPPACITGHAGAMDRAPGLIVVLALVDLALLILRASRAAVAGCAGARTLGHGRLGAALTVRGGGSPICTHSSGVM